MESIVYRGVLIDQVARARSPTANPGRARSILARGRRRHAVPLTKAWIDDRVECGPCAA